MPLFEQLKGLPKVDLHINLTSSISTNLAFDLTNETSIQDIEEKMIQKKMTDYYDCLELPIKMLKTKNNLELAVNDLIDRLISNNVIYGELFLDLPLYNLRIDEEKLIPIVLNVIKKRQYNLQLVLCLSNNYSKDKNIELLNLLDKYYNQGINGVYFKKDKMTNIEDYRYIFDRLIKNNIPYILSMDTKLTNQNKDIYMNAKRIIYTLVDIDNDLLKMLKENNIMLEFSITSLMESKLISDLPTSYIFDLYKDNYLVTFTSRDMTVLNTDILNEYCVLFNNWSITIHDLIKILISNINYVNIDENDKKELINVFKEKSNLVL